MATTEEVLEALSTPAEIREVRLARADESRAFEQTLDLKLVRLDSSEIGVRFEGIQGFEFEAGPVNLPVVLQLDDVQSRGWERLKWRVTNGEQDIKLQFFCSEIALLPE